MSTTTKAKSASNTTNGTSANSAAKPKFEIAPQNLDPSYNQARRPKLPYALVVNKSELGGVFVEESQLIACGWKTIPDQLHTFTPGETELKGVRLRKARLIVYCRTPNYMRYKSDEEKLEHPELAGTTIGFYDSTVFDRNTMDACEDFAIHFLDKNNQPLHEIPLRIRFKNVAMWAFDEKLEAYYRSIEAAFAEYTGSEYSSKSDKWRSRCVVAISFTGELRGKGKNKQYCCVPESIVRATVGNFPQLYLGTVERDAEIQKLYAQVAGFEVLDRLPALAGTQQAALPPAPSVQERIEAAGDFDFEEGDGSSSTVASDSSVTTVDVNVEELDDVDDTSAETEDLDDDLDDDPDSVEDIEDIE